MVKAFLYLGFAEKKGVSNLEWNHVPWICMAEVTIGERCYREIEVEVTQADAELGLKIAKCVPVELQLHGFFIYLGCHRGGTRCKWPTARGPRLGMRTSAPTLQVIRRSDVQDNQRPRRASRYSA